MKTGSVVIVAGLLMAAGGGAAAEIVPPEQSPYGVNQRHFNCPEVGQSFDELGVRWVRFAPEWHRFEVERGKYEWDPKGIWTTLAKNAEALAKHDFTLSVLPVDPPMFLRDQPDANGRIGTWHFDPKIYTDFIEAFADYLQQKGVKIGCYEILNEYATQATFYEQDPHTWAPLYQAVFQMARRRDPKAVVAMDGMWGGAHHHLEDIYQLGLNKYFDVVNFHLYLDEMTEAQGYNPAWKGSNGWSRWMGPQPRSVSVNDLGFQLEYLHWVMQKYGDVKPIWVTEFGWSDETDEVTAEYLVEALEIFRRSGLVQLAFWYVGHEAWPSALVRGWGPSAAKTPAFHAYQDYIRKHPTWSGERHIVNAIPPASAALAIPQPAQWPDCTVEEHGGWNGSPAVRVDNATDYGAAFSGTVTVKCEAGRAYYLTARLKVKEKAPAAAGKLAFHAMLDIEMESGPRDGPAIGNYRVADTWRYADGWRLIHWPIVTVPKTRELRIRMGTWAGPGAAWLSDLKIEPLDIPFAPEEPMWLKK